MIDLLGDLLENLFVPSESSINSIISLFDTKFSFFEVIKNDINSIFDSINDLEGAPKFSLNVGATKYTNAQTLVILDLSWYAPYKEYGDLVLTGFIYIFFIWRLFISIPNIVNGVGGVIDSGYMIADIKSYNKFGFGRTNSLTKYQDNKNGGIFRK